MGSRMVGSAWSGVRAGEDSKDAVIREIKEETGIDVTNAEGGYAFSYKRVNRKKKIIICGYL